MDSIIKLIESIVFVKYDKIYNYIQYKKHLDNNILCIVHIENYYGGYKHINIFYKNEQEDLYYNYLYNSPENINECYEEVINFIKINFKYDFRKKLIKKLLNE